MKNILFFIGLFIPSLCIAKKAPKPNACDSMKAVVTVDDKLTSTKICANIEAALKTIILHKGEKFEVSRIDDSTLVAAGDFVMKKYKATQHDDTYGRYRIAHNADGNISFKLYINCKQGKFRYEFTDLLHYNARYSYDNICQYDSKAINFIEINGLRITFLYRINEIVSLMKKVNENTGW